MIIVEKFNPNKFDVEKVGRLRIADGVINVSEGYLVSDVFEDKNLKESNLWSDKSVDELRIEYWNEINKFLPRFKKYYQPIINDKTNNKFETYCPRGQQYLWHLMVLVIWYKHFGKLKLIYVSDREKAELIKRVVIWLNSQFD